MNPIEPQPEQFLLPAGTRAVRVAEHQPEYITLPSLVTPDGRIASQWMPTENELALLNNRVPVTLVIHTFNQPLQPIQITVGGVDLR